MAGKKDQLTRRDFLQAVSGAAVVGAAGGSVLGSRRTMAAPAPPPGATASGKATVALVRDAAALDEKRMVNGPVVTRMLDDAVTALFGEKTPEKAWGRLFDSEDVVGIKTNEWEFLPTPPALEEKIRQRVAGAGVPASKISLADRGIHENPGFTGATALVNIRPMRTHHWSGVGSCLKNVITFTPTPWDWHGDSCANLAGLWQLPGIRGKVRLNILVMLTPLFHGKGAHHYQAEYTWPYGGLLVGTDPVAVDATGLRILEAQRKIHFGEDLPFTVPPHHIRLAEDKHRLGVADPKRITIIRVGTMKNALI
jgi:hypothetical protein